MNSFLDKLISFLHLEGLVRRPSFHKSDMQLAIYVFNSIAHGFIDKLPLVQIPAVTCPRNFVGCGYVEGRTKGFKVSRSITLVEGDEDMSFSKLCVLVNDIPTLMLTCRGLELSVETLPCDHPLTVNPVWQFCRDVDELEQFPDPIKTILQTVFQTTYAAYAKRKKELKKKGVSLRHI